MGGWNLGGLDMSDVVAGIVSHTKASFRFYSAIWRSESSVIFASRPKEFKSISKLVKSSASSKERNQNISSGYTLSEPEESG